ncbi:hypothetical protein [Micromonospora sp. U21]|uniref:hypothetical protein n=1 Tax=Micromonospora sp. U21 TaxID=2824899 RepID=UPI001B3960E4|nr:hypothetical protein [Micromonospora sp. U21]MBQ0900474.1 hypothetical protein [Micromonospora sp. U21]
MGTLPFTLPTCEQPATVRMPVYTPANDGSGSSLDAIAYACTEHAGQAVTALRAADLSTYPEPIDPDVTRTCGHVHIFPTGGLADPADVAPDAAPPAHPEHPRWCDRDDCERRGERRSRALETDTNRPEAVIVAVALVQSLHPAAAPMVSLTAVDGPTAGRVVMSIGQARVLRYRLATLIDVAKGGRR